MTAQLLLASASSYKRDQLLRLGINFQSADANVDETPHPGEAPDALALRLAQRKATSLADDYPEHFILGADQTISLNQTLLHKPGTVEGALDQLTRLQGQTHHLYCAIALLPPGASKVITKLVAFEMTMRPLDADQIARYVHLDNPLDCAGSYKLEAAGIRLFRSMRGDDYTAIIGLPLTRVQDALEEAGFFSHT